MQVKSNLLKRMLNFKVIGVLIAMFVVISYLSFSGTYVKVNKDAHSIVEQKVYTSQSAKSKALGTLKKNQNIYVYGSQNGWYQIGYGKTKGWVVAKNVKMGKYVAPPIAVKKDGHLIADQKVYVYQNAKGKVLGSLKKNQNVYIYASQNGWYQIGYGKTKGWVIAKYVKLGKYVAPKPPTTGVKYPDGWVAPVLKSAWSSNQAVNYKTLQNELGFKDGGRIYGIPEYPQGVIHVVGQGGKDVDIVFFGWEDTSILPNSYRVPVVAKELFKLYFGKDADRVWNYFNKDDIPEQFTANGFKVTAVYSSATGSISLRLR